VPGRPPSRTSLFAAARHWDGPAVASALASAPDLATATDPQGRTALHLACSVKPGSSATLGEPHGIHTVTTLLAAGSPLEGEVPMDEDEGDFRATPIWYAVARGENLPLVRFLVERGANASHSLWAAVWRDDEPMCEALLKARPQLNLRAHGETPIFYAARLQRLKTLELLLKAGADVAVVDFKGRNALDIARARRLPEPVIRRMEACLR
jgi:ankyrin repeat protein